MTYTLTAIEASNAAKLAAAFDFDHRYTGNETYFAYTMTKYAEECTHHWFGDRAIGHGTYRISKWGPRHGAIQAAIIAGINADFAARGAAQAAS